VSRQVGNAVERNRVKRRLREAVRLSADDKFCAGHDYVLIGRRAALKASFPDLVGELAAALRRIHASGAAAKVPLHRAGAPRRSRQTTAKSDPKRTD
jgi:ribonuclease P protein component